MLELLPLNFLLKFAAPVQNTQLGFSEVQFMSYTAGKFVAKIGIINLMEVKTKDDESHTEQTNPY